MRCRRECILVFAGKVVARIRPLGALAHAALIDRAGERVEGHRVDHRPVAVLHSGSRAHEQVWRIRHRLHATGDDAVELACADELVGERDGIDARQAHLVDRERRDVHRDARLHSCLACGHLAGTCLQHLPHDHVLDIGRGDPRLG